MTESDWYAVLGVGRAASSAQIARAFRKAAFRWHPDRNAGRTELAHQQFLLVHRAYEILSDPLRRKEFDRSLEPRPVPVVAAPSPRRQPPRQKPKEGAEPLAPPPPHKPPAVSAFASRASWLVLGFFLHILGFFALLVVGPFAERRSRDDLYRVAPGFVEIVFPLGRIALLAALILAGLWVTRQETMSPVPAIVLGSVGGLIFVIERIALASVWAMGRGRPRRKSDS
jgi:hypothetical protein